MDDRQFDNLSRRIASLPLPRLPRRGLLALLGSGALAGALGLVATDPQPAAAKKNNKKCKKDGQKCDKQKCKKKDKKCCCEGKCKNNRCGKVCPTDAKFDFEWDTFDGGDSFDNPFGIATDLDGNIFVTDNDNQRVVAFNQNGNFLDEFGESGQGDNDFLNPLGIGFNERSNGNFRLYVVDPNQDNNNRRIRDFEGDVDASDFGEHKNNLGGETGDTDTDPAGVAVDSNNRVWITNAVTPGTIFLFDRDGNFINSFEPDFSSPGDDRLQDPEGIAAYKDSDGNTFVYVADTGNNRIVKFQYVNGDLTYKDEVGKSNGGSGTGNSEFNQPTGLAADDCGNVWVADRFNDRIAVFDKNLNFIDEFFHSFNEPTGVALGPDEDELYVTDSANDRVVAFTVS